MTGRRVDTVTERAPSDAPLADWVRASTGDATGGARPVDAATAAGAGAEAPTAAGWRIGDVAAQAGVSARTLRYYEERGIFQPAVLTAGGERRYDPSAVGQLRRILELRDGLGLTLEEVRVFIDSERRLDALRSAYHDTDEPGVRLGLVDEAMAIRRQLVERIDAKMEQLRSLRGSLVENIERKEGLLAELRSSGGRPRARSAARDRANARR